MSKPKSVNNLFYEMKADKINWTGYNSNIVDKAIDRGIKLEEENTELKSKASGLRRERAMKAFAWLGGMFGLFGGIALLIIGLNALSNSVDFKKIEDDYEIKIEELKIDYEFQLRQEVQKARDEAFKEGQYSKIRVYILNEFLNSMTPARIADIIEKNEGRPEE